MCCHQGKKKGGEAIATEEGSSTGGDGYIREERFQGKVLSKVLRHGKNSSEQGRPRWSKSSCSWNLEHYKVSLLACSLQALCWEPGIQQG